MCCLLGTVGTLMLWESIIALRRASKNETVTLREAGPAQLGARPAAEDAVQEIEDLSEHHPGRALGFGIGILTSVMGVGGGFIMVPAMIYLLRIPTNVVVGTSLFQIIFVSAYTVIVQATANYTVDIVLAFVLMIAGVIGAQYGVRVGQRLRGEQLRALLALLVLAVGIRLAIELVIPPKEVYSVVSAGLGF